MKPRTINKAATLPLGEHGVDIASGPDGTSLTVFTDGWPNGRRVHFNIWINRVVLAQLADVQKALKEMEA